LRQEERGLEHEGQRMRNGGEAMVMMAMVRGLRVESAGAEALKGHYMVEGG